MKVKSLIRTIYLSPIGKIEVSAINNKISRLNFIIPDNPEDIHPNDDNEISRQLDQYFAGNRVDFDLEIDLQGTAFQKKVWQEIREIPFGKKSSYSEIAHKIGHQKAARAVGMACNKNPLIILIPCHRIVGSSGSLTGYAGGLLKKQWLLTHENAI